MLCVKKKKKNVDNKKKKKKFFETETDQMVKTMRLLIMDEFKIVENSLTSNVRFMVEQLQQEVQEDIRAVQKKIMMNLLKSYPTFKLFSKTFKKVTMNLLKIFHM